MSRLGLGATCTKVVSLIPSFGSPNAKDSAVILGIGFESILTVEKFNCRGTESRQTELLSIHRKDLRTTGNESGAEL